MSRSLKHAQTCMSSAGLFCLFIQPFSAVWAANDNTIGAVTHSRVNRISRGNFSRGTSHLGFSIPCDSGGYTRMKQILLPLKVFRFSWWSLYAEIRILRSLPTVH